MELDRKELLNIYDAIKEKRLDRDNHIEIVQKLDTEIQNEILEYRIASVSRVLDYIHSRQSIKVLDKEYFDTLITHCCNKLNGNIDGIELELRDEM